MPTKEARYIRRVGDYILEIMPESQRRKEMVLAYITDRIMRKPRVRQLAIAAVIALTSSAATFGVDQIVDSVQAGPASVAARIMELKDGSLVLTVVKYRDGQPTLLLHKEPITWDRARDILRDPLWQEKAISAHARGA